MAYRGQGQKVQKVMVQPINLIFRYLQNRSRIQVWLYEQVNMRIEGCIIGFDEYMNLVLDDAEEIHSKTKSRKQLELSTTPSNCQNSQGSGTFIWLDTKYCFANLFNIWLNRRWPIHFSLQCVVICCLGWNI
ncbi:small nuclear ribonucleoprotein polypeptide E [Rhinolophus ferrumequinum]|uniref:Small nuclear ribonucleoprotein E n=1 Tax=Rhinolophus ferrumequinum TaxID=59479 RepID=A0A7J7SZC1_RHIFE|nr:small nuclear ribonucleoprotein polypeptide E [Rhinolophus ferrumequinum]